MTSTAWIAVAVACIAGGLAWAWRAELRAALAGRSQPPAHAVAAPSVSGSDIAGRLSTGTLARNTSLMAVGTVLSRVSGLVRILALAFVLGGGRLADSFNLANTTPNMIYDLVVGGVLAASLVPVFVQWLSEHDEEEAGRAMSAVITAAVAVLVVGSALTALAAPAIIGLYNVLNHGSARGTEQHLATELLWMFAPQVLFYGLATLGEGVLTARRRFAPPKFVPIINNVVAVVVLIALRGVMSSRDPDVFRQHLGWVLLLGIGTTSGVALQAVWLLGYLRDGRGRLRLVWDPRHPALRQVVRLAGWAFGWVVTNQVALIVVTVLANAHSGSFTAYTYAYLFLQMPYAVVAISLMTVFLPELAEAWTSRDRATFGQQTGRGLRITAVVVIPSAAAMFTLARPGLGLVLGYGGYRSAAASTADILSVFALGLPGFCGYAFLIRAFSSMQDTKTPFFLYLLENGLNVVLAFPLYAVYGVRGLAGALALAYTIAAVVAAVVLRRRAGGLEPGLVVAHARLLAAGAVAAAAMALFVQIFPPTSVQLRLLDAMVGGAAGVTVFVVAAQLLGATELQGLLGRLRRLR